MPFAVSGFEAEEILASIYALIKLRKQGKVINLYKSAVKSERNEKAYKIVHKYFEEYDAPWRGLGIIKGSGMALKKNIQNMMQVHENSRTIIHTKKGACVVK